MLPLAESRLALAHHALAPGQGRVAVRRVGHRSVATQATATSPLRLLLPRNHGRAAWIYLASLGGGLVDGDALALDLDVGPGASAMLATQSSTKVYRSAVGTTQRTTLRVDAGALAVVLPDPVVCFAGARYAQHARIELAPDASLVWLEALHAGRVARGERWAFARYASRTDVHRAGRLALAERVLLDPAHGSLAPRMRGCEALATLVLLGPAMAPTVQALLARFSDAPLTAGARALVAASPIETREGALDGAIVRCAGPTAAIVAASLRETLEFLPALLGDDPRARKW